LVAYRGVTFGLALCIEGTGSEVVAYLSMGGASVIIQPSFPDFPATPWPEGAVDPWTMDILALWPLKLRVRAQADQVTMISVLPAGQGSRSRIISPFGEQVACAASDGPQIVRAAVDLGRFPYRDSPVFRRRQQLPPRPVVE
jgi:predicted amidohydrolase